MTMLNNISISRLPRIEFGPGKRRLLPELITQYGKQFLLVTGRRSFQSSPMWSELQDALTSHSISFETINVPGEPSPELIDATVERFRGLTWNAVVGIGGGSALDAAKAIAGLLKVGDSVMDYLEGVGPEKTYQGPSIPFIAVPTTAGTGSEATKNAVLSVQGEAGFKKSFRHEQLVAEYAVVDPDLLSTCPADVIAANGMDALTQLIESCVSMKANRLTDALALDGLRAARDGLLPLYQGKENLDQARQQMAYAALISGITLAQVGLGSVHGLASPLGAYYPIPHGVVCGTLVAEATRMNIQAMLEREPGNTALDKYKRVAEIVCQQHFRSREQAWEVLVALLSRWTELMNLPRLSEYGVTEDALNKVVANARGSSMKTNPIVLTDDEIKTIVSNRM